MDYGSIVWSIIWVVLLLVHAFGFVANHEAKSNKKYINLFFIGLMGMCLYLEISGIW